MFVNALTTDDKYSGSNMRNFPQQFQTPLYQKQKIFSRLEHFQKKDEYSKLIISEIIDAEKRGYLNV